MSIGKNCATMKVEIQLAPNAHACVAPTASVLTSSELRIKGIGPKPTPKLPTKNKTATAERTEMERVMPMARRRELIPMPAMEMRRQVFRPILSTSGAQAKVTKIFKADTARLRRAELDSRRSAKRLTPYMMMLLMPGLMLAPEHRIGDTQTHL